MGSEWSWPRRHCAAYERAHRTGVRVFDATGSYEAVWWIAAGLGIVAAVLHAPIDDEPIERVIMPARA